MPTIIDALLYEIGFDARGVNSGSKQVEGALNRASGAAKKTGSSLDDMGNRGAEAFNGLKRAALEFIAVLTAGKGVKDFVQYNTRANVELRNQARNIGINVKALSDWESVARAFGGTAQDVAGSMQAIVSQAQTVSGRSNLALIFEQMGVSLFNANGQLRDMNSLMPDLAAAAQRLGPQKFMALATAAGISPGMVYVLEQGPQKIEALYRALQRYAVTPEQAQASADLLENWTLLSAQSESFGRTLLTDLTPALDGLMGQISKIINENQKWIDQDIGDLVKELSRDIKEIDWKKVADDFKRLVEAVAAFNFAQFEQSIKTIAVDANSVADAFGGWKTAIEVFTGVWVASKFAPLISTLITVARLAGMTTTSIASLLALSGDQANNPPANKARMMQGLSDFLNYNWQPSQIPSRIHMLPESSAPTQFLSKSGYSPEQYNAYRSAIATIESDNYQSVSPSGTYIGRYQMNATSIAQAASGLGIADPTRAQFLADPGLQDRLFAEYSKQNYDYIASHDPSFKSMAKDQQLEVLAYAWNQGAAGAVKWLNTGVPQTDGNGTSALLYSKAVRAELNSIPQSPTPARVAAPPSPLQHAAAIAAAHAAIAGRNSASTIATTITAPITINAPNANPQAVGQSVKKHLQDLQFRARQANMGLQ